MNQQQRDFLVKTMEQKVHVKINELKNKKQALPSLSNYIWKESMTDSVLIKDSSVIKAAIKRKALKAKEGKNWLGEEPSWYKSTDNTEELLSMSIKIDILDLVEVPKDFRQEFENVTKFNNDIDTEIAALKEQLETLIFRVKLSSDKTLQQIVNDVDDMGNLSLVDAKIKFLNQ